MLQKVADLLLFILQYVCLRVFWRFFRIRLLTNWWFCFISINIRKTPSRELNSNGSKTKGLVCSQKDFLIFPKKVSILKCVPEYDILSGNICLNTYKRPWNRTIKVHISRSIQKSPGDFPNPPVSLPKSGGKPEKRLAVRQVFFWCVRRGSNPDRERRRL